MSTGGVVPLGDKSSVGPTVVTFSSAEPRYIQNSLNRLFTLTVRSHNTARDPRADCRYTTSSNGNIFRVTGHLCGEFTGPR